MSEDHSRKLEHPDEVHASSRGKYKPCRPVGPNRGHIGLTIVVTEDLLIWLHCYKIYQSSPFFLLWANYSSTLTLLSGETEVATYKHLCSQNEDFIYLFLNLRPWLNNLFFLPSYKRGEKRRWEEDHLRYLNSFTSYCQWKNSCRYSFPLWQRLLEQRGRLRARGTKHTVMKQHPQAQICIGR